MCGGIHDAFQHRENETARNTELFDADYKEVKMKRLRRDDTDCITLLCEHSTSFVFFVVNLPMF